MNPLTEFLLFFFGLIFSAFFSGAEAVLLSIPIERSKQLIANGGIKGRSLKFLASRSQEILTTILLGNNIVNVFIASLTAAIAHRIFESNIITYSVGITSFFILIFGEIIPKILARTHAENLIIPVIGLLRFFYFLFWLVIKPLTRLMVWLLGENAQLKGRMITRQDIEFMVNQAEKEKSMDAKQLDLLTSILEFPTIKVKDVMVPRSRINSLALDAPFREVADELRESSHSRYPVHKDNLDEIVGFFHIKDFALMTSEDKEKFSLSRFIKEPFFVYEHMKIQSVFEHMNRNRVHLAFVKDENGVMVGIVTLEDIMEEIFGEIQDEHDTDEDLINPDRGEITQDGVLLEASLSLRDLYNEFEVKIPLNDNYSTLAGFILDMLDNQFPKVGQVVIWDKYSFELVKVSDDSTIEEVLIKEYGLSHEQQDLLASHHHFADKGSDEKDHADKDTSEKSKSEHKNESDQEHYVPGSLDHVHQK